MIYTVCSLYLIVFQGNPYTIDVDFGDYTYLFGLQLTGEIDYSSGEIYVTHTYASPYSY